MKKIKLLLTTMITAAMFSVTAFAAGWTAGEGADIGRWWYDLGNGSYYAGSEAEPSWQWLDGNQDGVAECYAFDAEGWMYADTATPDGYQVDADGAWMVNGEVQHQIAKTADIGNTAENTTDAERNVLIVYYSRTNTTERVANRIQQTVGGTMFELQPADPYPSSYTATTERAQREINAGTLPALVSDIDIETYDIVFVGYPIWWGTTPPVVNTFLNNHDFTGKTVIPFCTSGGSGISGSLPEIRRYCAGAQILDGRDLTRGSADTVQNWLREIGVLP